jgi:hypothetical protein
MREIGVDINTKTGLDLSGLFVSKCCLVPLIRKWLSEE